jgi:hypothetical protein
MQDKLRIINL